MAGIRGSCPRDDCDGTILFEEEHPHVTGIVGACDTCEALFLLSKGETTMLRPPPEES
ncbi:MAG TPA: hypothetical protein VFV00_15270 [Acidimicrobiales bacterium]|nr:hypothetical protein [Acidimicrobiales bacterium]